LYDIYFGTTPNPPLVAADAPLGPTEGASPRVYQLPALAPFTTYYWRIVAKTMALQTAAGPVWSFTTGGAPAVAPQPFMSIDVPAANAVVRQPFALAGWALDLAAAGGTGVDVVHAYAYPYAGGPPVFLGAALPAGVRSDVAGVFGARFASSSYSLPVRGLPPGAYLIIVYAHSTVSGTFVTARTVDVRVESATAIFLDTPSNGASVGQRFVLAGWALDFGASSGGGVDVVHVYAYPLDWSGGPVFLGQAPATVSRPDVGAAFGGQFGAAGFSLSAPALPPGRYRVVAYAHSVVAWAFTAVALVDVQVR
jgi:hypothetical protein